MAVEPDRRKDAASASGQVQGNASWVAEPKSAQERADSVAAQQWMEAVTGQRFANGQCADLRSFTLLSRCFNLDSLSLLLSATSINYYHKWTVFLK